MAHSVAQAPEKPRPLVTVNVNANLDPSRLAAANLAKNQEVA